MIQRWEQVRPGIRAAVALGVTGLLANAAVFGVALAVAGPYGGCDSRGPGIGAGWLVAVIGLALAAVITVGHRCRASPLAQVTLALMQLSLSLGLSFTAMALLPLAASASCPASF